MDLSARSLRHLTNTLVVNRRSYSDISARLSPIRLASKIADTSKMLAALEHRAESAAADLTAGRHLKLERALARLDALSPLAVLTRGYSIVQKGSGAIVRDSHQTEAGESVTIRLASGTVGASITNIQHNNEKR
jgi:exodeoxyribonuclease VII large subunit